MKPIGFNIAIGIAILGNVNWAFGQAVVSLEAEVKNGVPIPSGPIATVEAAPGDVLELIFRVRSWGTTPPPNSLKGYQCAIEFGEYLGACNGNVLPVGFYETTDPEQVCPDGEPFGSANQASCFIDIAHPSFIFRGPGTAFLTTNSDDCKYRWAGAVLSSGAPDPGGSAGGIREYIATLIVQVSDDAAGVFVLDPDPDPIDGTFLRNQNSLPIVPLLFEPCTIIVSDPPHIVGTNPPNGAIDARQPHAIDDAEALQGWDSLSVQFNEACESLSATADDFIVDIVPPGDFVPSIIDVVVDGHDAVLHFDSPIPAGHWTRVTFLPDGTSICLGSLPGDVDNNRTASPADILKLIDSLVSLTTYKSFQTDIDRSGMTNPADVLREIDLLNGADAFEPWNWSTLPPNPCN